MKKYVVYREFDGIIKEVKSFDDFVSAIKERDRLLNLFKNKKMDFFVI